MKGIAGELGLGGKAEVAGVEIEHEGAGVGKSAAEVLGDVAGGGAYVQESEALVGKETFAEQGAEFAAGAGPTIDESEVSKILFQVGIASRCHGFFT